jgi:hypothetical protein
VLCNFGVGGGLLVTFESRMILWFGKHHCQLQICMSEPYLKVCVNFLQPSVSVNEMYAEDSTVMFKIKQKETLIPYPRLQEIKFVTFAVFFFFIICMFLWNGYTFVVMYRAFFLFTIL